MISKFKQVGFGLALLLATSSYAHPHAQTTCALSNTLDTACNILKAQDRATIHVHYPADQKLRLISSLSFRSKAQLVNFLRGIDVFMDDMFGGLIKLETEVTNDTHVFPSAHILLGPEDFFVGIIMIETNNNKTLAQHSKDTLIDNEFEVLDLLALQLIAD